MNNSFGIFSDSLEANKNIIYKIGKECKKLGDTVLFTDSVDTNAFVDYAIFSSFYMRFFKGIIIFLNIEDHTQYKDIIMGKPMMYLTEELLKSKNMDLSLITKNSVFPISGDNQ